MKLIYIILAILLSSVTCKSQDNKYILSMIERTYTYAVEDQNKYLGDYVLSDCRNDIDTLCAVFTPSMDTIMTYKIGGGKVSDIRQTTFNLIDNNNAIINFNGTEISIKIDSNNIYINDLDKYILTKEDYNRFHTDIKHKNILAISSLLEDFLGEYPEEINRLNYPWGVQKPTYKIDSVDISVPSPDSDEIYNYKGRYNNDKKIKLKDEGLGMRYEKILMESSNNIKIYKIVFANTEYDDVMIKNIDAHSNEINSFVWIRQQYSPDKEFFYKGAFTNIKIYYANSIDEIKQYLKHEKINSIFN